MCRTLEYELSLQKEYLKNDRIKTVYFGGGTPSLLSDEELQGILHAARTTFHFSEDAEITLEANPDDLSAEKLKALKASGINRLSIGIQSFDDNVLQFLNRNHTGKTARECVENARTAGFQNISIDLIYAIPGLTNAAWETAIQHALQLNPQHISSYSLTIEEKTTFGKWSVAGKLKAVDPDTAATQLEILMDRLGAAGFEHYEISNFCMPGFHSNHNSNYWKQEKYLGVGPSAHSYDGETRQFNISNNHGYVKSLGEGKIPFTLEILSREDKINEYLLTSLRTSWGCDLGVLERSFQHDLLLYNHPYIDTLLKNDLAILEKNTLTLTRRGKLLADKIASDLFLLTA